MNVVFINNKGVFGLAVHVHGVTWNWLELNLWAQQRANNFVSTSNAGQDLRWHFIDKYFSDKTAAAAAAAIVSFAASNKKQQVMNFNMKKYAFHV